MIIVNKLSINMSYIYNIYNFYNIFNIYNVNHFYNICNIYDICKIHNTKWQSLDISKVWRVKVNTDKNKRFTQMISINK